MDQTWASALANFFYILLQMQFVIYGVIGLLLVLFSVKLWKKVYGINASCACGYKRDERIG